MDDDYPAVGTTLSLPLPVILDSLCAVRPLLPASSSSSSPDDHRLVPTAVDLQTRMHPLGKGVTVKCKLGSRPSGRRRPGERRLSDDELCSFRLVLQLSDCSNDTSLSSYTVTESVPHSHYPHQHQHTLLPRDCLDNEAHGITVDPSSSSRLDFENRRLVFRSDFTVPILNSDIPRTTAHPRSSNRLRPASLLDHDEDWQRWEDTVGLDGGLEEKRKRRKVVMEMGGLGALKEWGWVDGLDEFGEEEDEVVELEETVLDETERLAGATAAGDVTMGLEQSGGKESGAEEEQVSCKGEEGAAASAVTASRQTPRHGTDRPTAKSGRRRRSRSSGSPAWLAGIARSSRQATRRIASPEPSAMSHEDGASYDEDVREVEERFAQVDDVDEAVHEEEAALDRLASNVAAFLVRPQTVHIKTHPISTSSAPPIVTPFTPPARNVPYFSPSSPTESSVTTASPVDSYFSPCGERDTSLSSVETPIRSLRPRSRSVRFVDEEEATRGTVAAEREHIVDAAEPSVTAFDRDRNEGREVAASEVDQEREEQALQALLGLSGWRPQPPALSPPPPQPSSTHLVSEEPPPPASPNEAAGDIAASPLPVGPSPSSTSALAFRPRVSSSTAARRQQPTSALFIPSARKSALTFSSGSSKASSPFSPQARGSARAVAIAQASAREKEAQPSGRSRSGCGTVGATTSSQPDETALAVALRERLLRSGGDTEGGRLDSLYSTATLDKKLEQIRSVTSFPTPSILCTPSSAVYLSLLSAPHRPSRARLPTLQSLPTFDTPPDVLGLFNDKRIRFALEYLYGRSVSVNEMAFLERREKAVWTLAKTMAAVAEVNERVARVRSGGSEQGEPRWLVRDDGVTIVAKGRRTGKGRR